MKWFVGDDWQISSGWEATGVENAKKDGREGSSRHSTGLEGGSQAPTMPRDPLSVSSKVMKPS